MWSGVGQSRAAAVVSAGLGGSGGPPSAQLLLKSSVRVGPRSSAVPGNRSGPRWHRRASATALCVPIPTRPHHRLAQACWAERRKSGGASVDLSLASCDTSWMASSFHRPNTSHPRTTKAAMPELSTSAYLMRFFLSARATVCPSVERAPARGAPRLVWGLTMVTSQNSARPRRAPTDRAPGAATRSILRWSRGGTAKCVLLNGRSI